MKKRWVICLLVFIAALAGVAVWLAWRAPAQMELDAYKRELTAKGEKLAQENWLPPPDRGSNGAALLVETLAQFYSGKMISGVLAFRMITNNHAEVMWRRGLVEAIGQSPALDVWAAMEDINRTNRFLFANIMTAVHTDYVQVPYDYVTERFPMTVTNAQWGSMSPYPTWLDIRVVKPLSAVVCLRLRQNRPEDAWDELAALMELAQQTCSEPNLTSLKSHAEIVQDLFETTWAFMQFTNLPETHLRLLQTDWEDLDLLHEVEPAFALQRAYVEDRNEAMRRKLSLWHKSTKELFKILTGLIKNFSASKKTLLHNALLVRQSYTNEIADYRNAQAELEAARSLCRIHAVAGLNDKLPHADVLEGVAIAETQRQLVIAAIALQRYQLENSRFPASLSELQPAFLKAPPLDFMDGKSLRYKPDQAGLFLLYSVGLDGQDDGGVARPKPRSYGPGGRPAFPAWAEGQDMVWPIAATDAEVAERMAAVQNSRPRPPTH